MTTSSTLLLLLLCNLPVVRSLPILEGLIDPDLQPKFKAVAPNLLADSHSLHNRNGDSYVRISASQGTAYAGLLNSNGEPLPTQVYGYDGSWPGPTIHATSYYPLQLLVQLNKSATSDSVLTDLQGNSLVDHSASSLFPSPFSLPILPGEDKYTLQLQAQQEQLQVQESQPIPVVTTLHGAHTADTRTLQREDVATYRNEQPATMLWYHDQTLGLTRLNVYAGLTGLYILRDQKDTGKPDNPLHLPAFPYEAAFVIQRFRRKDHVFEQRTQY